MPLANIISGGTWTPVLTFATPGDLSVTYSAQTGIWRQFGDVIAAQFSIVTSAFTHTTASGNLRITGLPFTVGPSVLGGPLEWQGITKANYTQMTPRATASNTYVRVFAHGSGQTSAALNAADMPTGGTVSLIGVAWFTL